MKSRQFVQVGLGTRTRQREFLTEGEIDTLLTAAGNSRNPGRDPCTHAASKSTLSTHRA